MLSSVPKRFTTLGFTRLEGWLSSIEKYPSLLILAYSLPYFLLTLVLAGKKLLWDDEFFTLYISTVPDREQIWSALMTGAEQHPPLFYWMHHYFFQLFGVSHVTLRFPTMLGVWLMSVFLFRFVAKRTSNWYGLAAALFVLNTNVYCYAYEARGYGMALAWTALALLAWQEVTRPARKIKWVLVLGISLMFALGTHYYAIFILGPLLAAEVTRFVKTKRIDIPVALALCASIIPLLFFLPIINAARTYSLTFWAKPAWSAWQNYYPAIFNQSMFGILLTGTIIFALQQLVGRNLFPADKEKKSVFPAHEVILLFCLVLLPLGALLAAKLVTNSYHTRYVLYPVLGVTPVLMWLGYFHSKGSRLLPAIFSAIMMMSFLLFATLESRNLGRIRQEIMDGASFLQSTAHQELPLVIADVTAFHQFSYYAPPKLARRVTYLGDPEYSIKYLGHDTVDKGMLALRPWFPLQTEQYRTFVQSHDQFLVYGSLHGWSWVLSQLVKEGFKLEVLGRNGGSMFVLASHSPPPEKISSTLESERFRVNQSMYPLRLKRGVPSASTSTCANWTADPICSSFLTGTEVSANRGLQSERKEISQ